MLVLNQVYLASSDSNIPKSMINPELRQPSLDPSSKKLSIKSMLIILISNTKFRDLSTLRKVREITSLMLMVMSFSTCTVTSLTYHWVTTTRPMLISVTLISMIDSLVIELTPQYFPLMTSQTS